MAWIAIVPPSPRHPHERYQVRYQDGRHQRSAGIFPTYGWTPTISTMPTTRLPGGTT